MDRIMFTFIIILGLSSINLINGEVTPQMLKTVKSGTNPNTAPSITAVDTPDAEKMRRNTGSRFVTASSICARGIWALYNNTDFGEGNEASTSVIVIKATDIFTCPGNISLLPKTKSVNYLGNADMSVAGLDIYGGSFFLGAAWKLTAAEELPTLGPPKITGFPLGSLAITGATTKWRICGDKECNNAVCVDMSLQTGGLFMVPNAASDSTTPWPKVVRKVELADDCSFDNQPPVPTAARVAVGSLQVGARSLAPKKGVVEVVTNQ